MSPPQSNPPPNTHHPSQAFRRQEILELARRNPYSYTLKPRLGTALQLLNATDLVTRRIGDFTHPFLVLQGLADVVTDPKLAKEFHDRAASQVGGWVGGSDGLNGWIDQ